MTRRHIRQRTAKLTRTQLRATAAACREKTCEKKLAATEKGLAHAFSVAIHQHQAEKRDKYESEERFRHASLKVRHSRRLSDYPQAQTCCCMSLSRAHFRAHPHLRTAYARPNPSPYALIRPHSHPRPYSPKPPALHPGCTCTTSRVRLAVGSLYCGWHAQVTLLNLRKQIHGRLKNSGRTISGLLYRVDKDDDGRVSLEEVRCGRELPEGAAGGLLAGA